MHNGGLLIVSGMTQSRIAGSTGDQPAFVLCRYWLRSILPGSFAQFLKLVGGRWVLIHAHWHPDATPLSSSIWQMPERGEEPSLKSESILSSDQVAESWTALTALHQAAAAGIFSCSSGPSILRVGFYLSLGRGEACEC
ncbi:uncharacterized protein MYCFIDRAFT_169936 [Pseudocercospora fijiensis CIRAD86]|uniref:Uncharacterized protein n=1 Tax=Pseudocercospora fijiensis (strain CIRAD86) TaxID=383855 RepID=N1Q6W7_PSEFD|nr:uncharacterized protein MYCFIDRAFT_169936 [Pseudocercospora fijiensis CIRAD86]EME88299.1 hypothetical protein MYCFIDRAFT_169936 [Pseudocercospora fijiensis CIRAD86]